MKTAKGKKKTKRGGGGPGPPPPPAGGGGGGGGAIRHNVCAAASPPPAPLPRGERGVGAGLSSRTQQSQSAHGPESARAHRACLRRCSPLPDSPGGGSGEHL